MKRALAVAALCGLCTPAVATEWVYCNDATSTVTVGLLLGAMDMLNVSGIILSNGDRVWASDASYGPGEPVSLGQGFETADTLVIDLMDGDYAKLAELRLMKATEGVQYVSAGTLRIVGQGAWAVSCEGP